MILVTTETVPGRTLARCLGLVTAEIVVAPTASQTLTFSREKLIDVRQSLLFEARESALQRLADIAAQRNGDAVVGVRLDYEQMDPTYCMMMVTAAGTVVTLAPEEPTG